MGDYERYPRESAQPEWLASMTDPIRDQLVRTCQPPSLDAIRALFPPTTGDAPFDPMVVASSIERLVTVPAVETGHPYLDLSVKTGLAYIDATFQGDYPKYGVKHYGEACHDGFPPTIIAATDALSGWGLGSRSSQLFRYWLLNFVHDDGTIHYRGTSLAELGQLLHTAALLEERIGPDAWLGDGLPRLRRVVERLIAMRREAEKGHGLLAGVPEDDQRHKIATYFHNNAWVARGLQRWAGLCDRRAASPALAAEARTAGVALEADTLAAIRRTWPADSADWWLPSKLEPMERPGCLTANYDASYTNYRYWPELLASGVLPRDMADRLVASRLTGGGQFCGMTRFSYLLDDWPLADYLTGLWRLGRRDDFLLTLYGHVAYHQAGGHLTAYESVTFPPGKENAAYCLPCQLVAARAARLLVKVQ